MITNLILNAIFAPLNYLISFLPVANLGQTFDATLTAVSGYTAALNAILPMSTILTLVGIFVGFEVAYTAYKVIYWVIKKIPTIS